VQIGKGVGHGDEGGFEDVVVGGGGVAQPREEGGRGGERGGGRGIAFGEPGAFLPVPFKRRGQQGSSFHIRKFLLLQDEFDDLPPSRALPPNLLPAHVHHPPVQHAQEVGMA
jgi:hypothetical protein